MRYKIPCLGVGPSSGLTVVFVVAGMALNAAAESGFGQIEDARETRKTIEVTAPQAFERDFAHRIEALRRGNLSFGPYDSASEKIFKRCAINQTDDTGTPIYGEPDEPAFNVSDLKNCFVNETILQTGWQSARTEGSMTPISNFTAALAYSCFAFAAGVVISGAAVNFAARRSNNNSGPSPSA